MKKSSPPLIIPAALDDAGLNAGEFRILAHLSRRTGTNGRCWPSTGGIAKHCLMTRKTVRKHLQALEARGAIVRSRKDSAAGDIVMVPTCQMGAGTGVKITQVPEENLPAPLGNNYPDTWVKITHKGVKEGIKEKESKDPPFLTDDLEMPFDSPEFLEAWNDWKSHRREQRKKFTPTAARLQLAELKTMGETRAVAALRHSTKSGYMGIFEPPNGHSAPLKRIPQEYGGYRIAKSIL